MIVPRAGLGKGIAGTGVVSRQIGAGAYPSIFSSLIIAHWGADASVRASCVRSIM
jgi:hypothetical protein